MKKFVCAAAAVAVGICSLVSFGGCKVGEAKVEYALSEDETYYIVSGVSGDKRGLTSFDVPAEVDGKPVKEIGYEAFFECNKLTRVTLPDSIGKIGERAFARCSFSQFTIPDGVTEIGYGAFGMCEQLTEITIPESVSSIAPLAFAYCTSLEKAVVNANITVLEDKVFYNSTAVHSGNIYTNTSLTSVYLSASIKKIRDTALAGNLITHIYFAGSQEQWDELYFYRTEQDESKPEGYREVRLEKKDVLSDSIKIEIAEK